MLVLHGQCVVKPVRDALATLAATLPLEDKRVSDRLNRAYDIVNGYGYTVEVLSSDKDAEYAVYKASTTLLEDTSVCYSVTQHSCTCLDYEKARGNLCKHRLAVMIVREMMRV